MTNLSNLSPVAVDTIYVYRLSRLDAANREAGYATDALLSGFGKPVYLCGYHGARGREVVYVHPDAVVKGNSYHSPVASLSLIGLKALTPSVAIEAIAAGHPKVVAYDLHRVVDRYEAAGLALTDANLAVEEVEEEYRSRPWSRFWLVTTSNGHIHRSTHCSTCNRRGRPTGFALVPYLSGQTAADAVADLGPALCSVCFPEAPVEDKEQATIPARLALALKEQGSEAFLKARQEASEKAKAKAADRCPGAGERVQIDQHGYVKCPCCGWECRSSTGKVAAHRRPRYYAVRVEENAYGDKYWNGQSFGPSTKKVAFESREAAEAVPGVTKVLRD
jgi:nitrite reductase/ring-hydroxylating ferredoxin subunit